MIFQSGYSWVEREKEKHLGIFRKALTGLERLQEKIHAEVQACKQTQAIHDDAIEELKKARAEEDRNIELLKSHAEQAKNTAQKIGAILT